jgi:Spy/CpxP family protein refolding chaperone
MREIIAKRRFSAPDNNGVFTRFYMAFTAINSSWADNGFSNHIRGVNMKGIQIRGLAVAAAVAVGLSVGASAQDMEHGPMGPRHGGMHDPAMMALHHLQLTQAQQDSVHAILKEQAPRHAEIQKKIRAARDALHALAMTGQFDEAKAQGPAQDLGQATTEAALQQARVEASIVAVLTPEQRDQLSKAPPERPGRP